MSSRREVLELVRIVAAAIEKHARDDVEKLALVVQRRARNTRSGDRRAIFSRHQRGSEINPERDESRAGQHQHQYNRSNALSL